MNTKESLLYVCKELEPTPSFSSKIWSLCEVCMGLQHVMYSTTSIGPVVGHPCLVCYKGYIPATPPSIGDLILAARKLGLRIYLMPGELNSSLCQIWHKEYDYILGWWPDKNEICDDP